MASAVMQLVAAPDLCVVLRRFLVLPSYMLLCGASRLPGTSVPDQCARLREAHPTYNYVVQCVQAALLHGVFCPGLECRATGVLLLDAQPCTLESRIMRDFAFVALDATPLDPFLVECDGNPMAAWHIDNAATPAWLCLSSLLTDDRARVDFQYYCSPAGRRCFAAELLIDTLRFALVFEHDPAAVIQVD